jgi:hypothetical protein
LLKSGLKDHASSVFPVRTISSVLPGMNRNLEQNDYNTENRNAKSRRTLTAYTGTNADLLPHILGLYVKEGSVIADVTYGFGVFWRQVDTSRYTLLASDLMEGLAPVTADFKSLPYEDRSIDALVLDPPYMHDGSTVAKAIDSRYQNNTKPNTSHESVIRLYAGGVLEAARVLKKKGIIVVKCQDETESGKQCLSHVELIKLLELFGYQIIDLFILVQSSTPILQVKEQQSARKNHSYALVARFRR